MKKKQRKEHKCERDALTGKKINPNKPVILVENIEEYIKKMGYEHKKPTIKEIESNMKLLLCYIGLIISVILINTPLISASTGILSMDFTSNISKAVTVICFIIAGIFYYYNVYILSGLIILIFGVLFALNGINLIVSIVVIMISIGILSKMKGGK